MKYQVDIMKTNTQIDSYIIDVKDTEQGEFIVSSLNEHYMSNKCECNLQIMLNKLKVDVFSVEKGEENVEFETYGYVCIN